jgi:hypothetical protein
VAENEEKRDFVVPLDWQGTDRARGTAEMRLEMRLTSNELSTTLESEIERLRAELLQANARVAQISSVKRLDRRGKRRWLKFSVLAIAWILSLVLTMVMGLWILLVANPPGTFHDYRGIAQTFFQRIQHDKSMSFYGPVTISARWENEPYWHQMTVSDLTISWADYVKGREGERKAATRLTQTQSSYNSETKDEEDRRFNASPSTHLTPGGLSKSMANRPSQ